MCGEAALRFVVCEWLPRRRADELRALRRLQAHFRRRWCVFYVDTTPTWREAPRVVTIAAGGLVRPEAPCMYQCIDACAVRRNGCAVHEYRAGDLMHISKYQRVVVVSAAARLRPVVLSPCALKLVDRGWLIYNPGRNQVTGCLDVLCADGAAPLTFAVGRRTALRFDAWLLPLPVCPAPVHVHA